MKFDKLKMPPKKKPSMMDDYSMGPSDSEQGGDATGELMGESEGETGREPSMEEESAEGEPMGGPDLGEVSDDELMAELRKRGLSSKVGK